MAQPGGKSTKANREGLDELVRLYARRDSTDLLWFDEVGRLLRQLERCDAGLYGKGFIHEAAEKLQGELSVKFLVLELSVAKRFVEDFPKRTEVKTLVARARRQGMALGVTHAVYLNSVADTKKRWSFIEKCLQEKWTGARLRAEIKRHRTKRKTSGRGFTIPASRMKGLQNLIEKSDEWLRRCTTIWFAGSRPVTDDADGSEPPEALKELFRDAQKLLRQMGTAIEHAIPKLRAAEQQAKKAAQNGRRPKRGQTPVAEALEHMGSSFLK
jgi:DUF1016 N-terminal domain